MRMSRPELTRTPVHDLCKCFYTAGIITRQTSRDIAWAFYKQCSKQIDSLIRVARVDVQFHRVSHGVGCLDRDGLIQKTVLRDDQSSEQPLCARCCPYVVSVSCAQCLTG